MLNINTTHVKILKKNTSMLYKWKYNMNSVGNDGESEP